MASLDGKRARIRSLLLVAFLACAVILAGCGGGGSSSPEPGAPILRDHVVVLPGDAEIASQTDTSVTLTGNVPTLQPGYVIVSGVGQGLLRKVVSVQQNPTSVVVQTTQGTLEDVFQQANIHLSKTLSSSDIASVQPLAAGVTVRSRASGGRADVYTTELTLDDVALYGSKDAGITASGTIRLKELSIEFVADLANGQLNYLRFVPTVTSETEVTVKGTVTVASVSARLPIALVYGAPIPLVVGGLPLVFVPMMTIYVGFDGQLEVGAELKVIGSVTAKAGLEYAGGQWHGVADLTTNVNLPTGFVPNPDAQVSATACLCGVDLSLILYAVAGPYCDVKLPYIESSWKFTALPSPEYEVDLSFGVRATAGVHVEVLGRTIAEHELTGVLDSKTHFPGCPMTFPAAGNVNVIAN